MGKPTITIQKLLLTLFVILVGFAFCKSFQVAGSTRIHNQADELKEEEGKEKAALASASSGETRALKRQLAQTLWQENNFAEAGKLLTEVPAVPEKKGDARFVSDKSMLAALSLDAGALPEAINLYQSILAYDRENLGDSTSATARDLNNLGVACYMAGQTSEDPAKRNTYFSQASDYYSQAAEVIRRLGNDRENSWRLERILANQDLAIRDLNKANQAPFDFHKSPNNQML
ncbi:MAG: hypothetical protein C5B53_05430 [Candidatus Melainabacteria bacterium]|nr:MAG: hypothetical protein C5B53_05430 [Candidatus Melainabacteria bacterium]